MIKDRSVTQQSHTELIYQRRRTLLVLFFCLFAIFQSGLRDINNLPDGNDTPNYLTRYEEVSRSSWGELIGGFSVYNSDYDERDKGYPIFMKLTQIFVNDFTFFMFLTASIFIISLGCLINKYVKSHLGILLSFLIYFALFANVVNSFMRQAITLSIVMFALRYVLSRDWKRFFAFMLLAFTFHSSAIIATLFYFLPWFCQKRKWLLLALIISPIMVYCVSFIMSILLAGSVYEQYAADDADNPINYIMLVYVVSLFIYLYYDKIKEIKGCELLLSGTLGSMILLPIAFLGNTILRVSYYYVLFLVVLVPVLIDHIKTHKSIRLLVYYLSICFFLYYIIK